MAQDKRPFRIIIVGAGVAGLVASSCLQKLGIDHVVLEKYAEVAPSLGAGISMWPHALRILSQLGYLDALKNKSVPLNRFQNRNSKGRLIHDVDFFPRLQENHGIGFYPFERRQFLQILYDGLPDKSFIKTSIAIENVEQFDDRVEVTLKNGTVETGDMILGCDGVHSFIRTKMWEHASLTSPGLIRAKEKTSLKTEWKTLLVTTPGIPELGERDLTVTYNDGFTFLATSQPNAVYFFVIFRLDKSFTWPQRAHYTDDDADAIAELVANRPVTDNLVFGEVWKRRTRSSVISLEECVMEHWHHGRIVLAGDAAHKLHPNLALGGNSAIESVASLMNNIHAAVQKAGDARPSGTALNMAFAAYQSEQRQRMRDLMMISNLVAKTNAYATPVHKFIANWVLPFGTDKIIADQLGAYVSTATRLDFAPCPGFGETRLKWKSAEKVEEDDTLELEMARLDLCEKRTW